MPDIRRPYWQDAASQLRSQLQHVGTNRPVNRSSEVAVRWITPMDPILTGQWLDTCPESIVLLRDMHWRSTCWEELARSPGCRREAVQGKRSVRRALSTSNLNIFDWLTKKAQLLLHFGIRLPSQSLLLRVRIAWYDHRSIALFGHPGPWTYALPTVI